MAYLSCNAHSALAICDPNLLKNTRRHNKRPQPRLFTYDELAAATNGFSAANFLGKGSHGRVYKAVLDGGKLLAAVKRTTIAAGNFNSISPVDNEIEILSRTHQHRWMVNLIGFCVDRKRGTKLLVVEYMPNGTLYDLLHSRCLASPITSFNRRVKYAIQIAIAVHALHSSQTPIIHRDIKSSNILIDCNGNARLGDFGLALIGNIDDEHLKSTPPAGTLGYLDPSYLAPADLSAKSDVFSFGILLLEIISGRDAIDLNYSPTFVVDWAMPLIKRGEFDAICDSKIRNRPSSAVIQKMVVMAARCVRSTAVKRPDMTEVLECLKSIRKISKMPSVWNRMRLCEEDRSGNVRSFEENEEIHVKIVRGGSRKQRKVSSVTNEEFIQERVAPHPPHRRRDLVSRSRSVGAMRQSKVRPEPNDVVGDKTAVTISVLMAREGERSTTTTTTTTLSKSRSAGIPRRHKTAS